MQYAPGNDARTEGTQISRSGPPDVADPLRLYALQSYGVLDTLPEQGFDDVVRLATRLCAAPIALVSLVAADRQWFKAHVGFPTGETDLDRSVCAHALAEPDLLVIPDLAADPRTAANPLVINDPRIRFYAGAPLRTPEGQVLGSLCVIDTVTRPGGLTAEQSDDLRALAKQVMTLLALRRQVADRDQVMDAQRAKLRQAMRLDVLAQSSVALATALDPVAVLEPILAADAESVGFEQCFIYEITPNGDHLQLVRSAGVDDAIKPLLDCSHIDRLLCGIVVQLRRPLILRDVLSSTEPRYVLAQQTGINGFAGYPITSRGELVGVISFATRASGFNAEALSFFATLAALVSGVRERLDGEAAVRESDTRSRLAQEAGHVGTFEIDVASSLAKVSPELCRIFGLPVARMYAAEKFTALVLPEDRGLTSTEHTREAGTATPDVHYRIRRANDGAIRWVERNAKFVHHADGTSARMFGTVQDITDQQTLLEDLTRTEGQLRLAAEATRLGIFDFDPLTGALRWDARMRELFGVGPNAPVTYDTFLQGVHPEDRAATDAAMQGALDPTGSGMFETEYRVRPANGGPGLWLAARGRAIVQEGRTVRFVGAVRDVTTRRQAENALRKTEERYRLAVRATNDAVWDWDLLANTVLWNEALTEAHGHVLADVEPTGQWWLDHIHPEDRERVSHSIHSVINGSGRTWTDRYRFRRADGGYAEIVDRGFVIREGGKAVRMIGAMLDVTEQIGGQRRQAALVTLADQLREAGSSAEIVEIAAKTLGTTLGASRAGYSRIDVKSNLFAVERDWTAHGVASIAGRHKLSAFHTTVGQLRDGQALATSDVAAADWVNGDAEGYRAIGTRAQIKAPLFDHGELVGLLYLHQCEPRDWTGVEVAFCQAVADRTYAALAKLEAEAEQRVLNEELSHRLKNTFAMVLSIAAQSLRGVENRAPVQAFEQRIHALSSAHDVLLRQNRMGAPIGEVVRSVLANAGQGDRIATAGPYVSFGPRASLSLSLLLHELATNAAKYGALSVPEGRIAMEWRLEGATGEEDLVLDWTESGGPPATAPSGRGRRGFGSRLIQMGLTGTGGVDLHYEATGFSATMRAPLARLRHS